MNRGFTLVEMLVAIGLMALMALICWRGLVYVANQHETVARESVEISQLVRTFAQIERDLAERVPNAALPPAAVPTELPLAVAVHAEAAPSERGAVELEIARFLPEAGGAPRGVRVLYRVSAAGLSRSTRALAEAAPLANDVVLLPGAKALRVRVHAGGFWTEPGREPRVQPTGAAGAIEIALEDANGARYVKVLPL